METATAERLASVRNENARRVLVLDGDTRAALAVVRGLASSGFETIVAAPKKRFLAGSSRYAAKALTCPPYDPQQQFFDWLQTILVSESVDVLLPVTDISLHTVMSMESSFRGRVGLPFVPVETLRQVSQKDEFMDVAASIGIRVPLARTIVPQSVVSRGEHKAEIDSFPYPAVLKPTASVRLEEQSIRKGESHAVRYPRSAAEVYAMLDSIIAVGEGERPFSLQQFVEGEGVGVFCLFWHGEHVTTFCHRRLLEKPPSGGVSVLSESISEESAPVADSIRLLKQLSWHGVGMMEFRQSRVGQFYLLELNPRFWGSLQLAVDCGRNFPAMLLELERARLVNDEERAIAALRSSPPFDVGRRLRWSLGCVDHLATLSRQPQKLRSFGHFAKLAPQLFSTKTRGEVMRITDPLPGIVELGSWLSQIL